MRQQLLDVPTVCEARSDAAGLPVPLEHDRLLALRLTQKDEPKLEAPVAIKAMAAKLRIVAARLWQLFLVIVITECARDAEKATKPYFTFPLSLVVATWRINFENDAPLPGRLLL